MKSDERAKTDRISIRVHPQTKSVVREVARYLGIEMTEVSRLALEAVMFPGDESRQWILPIIQKMRGGSSDRRSGISGLGSHPRRRVGDKRGTRNSHKA